MTMTESNNDATKKKDSEGSSRIRFSQIVGYAMIVMAWVGIAVFIAAMVLSPFAIYRGAQALGNVAGETAEFVLSISQTMEDVSDTLENAGKVVRDTSEKLGSVNLSLDSAVPFLTSVGELVGESAPDTIESTYNALQSVEQGARSIDSVLQALSGIPFIPIRYDPDRPFSESLSSTAESIEPLPDTLRGMQSDIDAFAETIGEVQPGLKTTANDLKDIAVNIEAVSDSLKFQAEYLERLYDSMVWISENVFAWSLPAILLTELFLLWIMFSQVTILYVGRRVRDGEF
jgi:methyl-accepting chemotaxis protein